MWAIARVEDSPLASVLDAPAPAQATNPSRRQVPSPACLPPHLEQTPPTTQHPPPRFAVPQPPRSGRSQMASALNRPQVQPETHSLRLAELPESPGIRDDLPGIQPRSIPRKSKPGPR